jgi:hypothetical protein
MPEKSCSGSLEIAEGSCRGIARKATEFSSLTLKSAEELQRFSQGGQTRGNPEWSCRGSLTEGRKEVQGLCQGGQKGIAGTSLCTGEMQELQQRCRLVPSGRADKSCSGYLRSAEGNFRAERSYLCFVRKGRKKL